MWKITQGFEYKGTSLPLSSIIDSSRLPFPLVVIDNKAPRKSLFIVNNGNLNLNGNQGIPLVRQQATNKEVTLEDSLTWDDLYINHLLPELNLIIDKVSLINKDTNLEIVSNLTKVNNFIELVKLDTYLYSENYMHIHGSANTLNSYLVLSQNLDKLKLSIEFKYIKVVEKILKDSTILIDLSLLNLTNILSISSKGLVVIEDSLVTNEDKKNTIRYSYNSTSKQLRVFNSKNAALRLNDPITIQGSISISSPNITTVKKTISLSTKQDSDAIYGIKYLTLNSITYYRKLIFSNLELTQPNINLLLFNKYANLAWCL
jgi:hypothetical protein